MGALVIINADLKKLFRWIRRGESWRARKFLSKYYQSSYDEAAEWCAAVERTQAWKWMDLT